MGLAWFLFLPLGSAALPTVFHFSYRTGTFFSATFDTNSVWYGYAWWTLWIGNLSINGLIWITELLATFGVLNEFNMLMWQILHEYVGTLHFLSVVAFYLIALYEVNAAAVAAQFDIIKNELTLYIAAYAWEKAMYLTYADSWLAGMMLPYYVAITSENDV